MENLDKLVGEYIAEVHAMGRYEPNAPFHKAHEKAADKIFDLIKYFMED